MDVVAMRVHTESPAFFAPFGEEIARWEGTKEGWRVFTVDPWSIHHVCWWDDDRNLRQQRSRDSVKKPGVVCTRIQDDSALDRWNDRCHTAVHCIVAFCLERIDDRIFSERSETFLKSRSYNFGFAIYFNQFKNASWLDFRIRQCYKVK